MADSMKTVNLDSMFVIKFVGHGIAFCLGGYGMVEGRIKNGDLFGIVKDLFREYDTFKIMGIVQGRQGSKFVDLILYLLVNDGGLGKAVAPMHHPVPYRIDLPCIF